MRRAPRGGIRTIGVVALSRGICIVWLVVRKNSPGEKIFDAGGVRPGEAAEREKWPRDVNFSPETHDNIIDGVI